MIAAGADLKIYIATRPIDFRCGHDGLAAKVQEMLRLDPFSGAAFVFRSKRADRIKILVWDRTGLVLVHKRLEGCKFVWPTIADGVMRISPAMFAALFEGLDWRLVRPEDIQIPKQGFRLSAYPQTDNWVSGAGHSRIEIRPRRLRVR